MKLNVQGHLKCWLWRLASLLWAEHKFNCGITGLRKDEKISSPSSSTTDEDIGAVKKMILDNRRITREVPDEVGISFGSCQAIFTDVLSMKRVAAKIVKFWVKTTLHEHSLGDVDDVQRRFKYAQI